MKSPTAIRNRVEGSLLILALMVVLVGAIVLAGWAQLIATRAAFADSALTGQNRRVAMENLRAIAKGYVLTNMVADSLPAATNSSTWGTVAFSTGASQFWTTSTAIGLTNATYKNPFSPMERWGYVTPVTATFTYTDSTTIAPWTFLMRTRSPIAAGYAMLVHQNASGNPSIASVTYSSNPYFNYTNYTGASSQTNRFAYLGLPQIPMTSVNNSYSYTNGYLGYFNAPLTSDSFGTLISGTNNTAAGTITVDLGAVDDGTLTNAVVRYTVPTMAGASALSKLILLGSANASQKAVHIVATNHTTLTNIVLSGSNARLIYINRSGSANMTLSTANFSGSWPMGISLQTTTMTISGTPTITGGIRSNASVTGAATVDSYTTVGPMDSMGERILWLEDFRSP